ncbi:hypothetical protein A2U01_0005583, partial [Trifolium medium]|nr:hypothetical protein [Trifolium medium]
PDDVLPPDAVGGFWDFDLGVAVVENGVPLDDGLNDETSDEESDEEVVNPGDYVAQPDDVLPPDAVGGFYAPAVDGDAPAPVVDGDAPAPVEKVLSKKRDRDDVDEGETRKCRNESTNAAPCKLV